MTLAGISGRQVDRHNHTLGYFFVHILTLSQEEMENEGRDNSFFLLAL